jgi:hypothetical protein
MKNHYHVYDENDDLLNVETELITHFHPVENFA